MNLERPAQRWFYPAQVYAQFTSGEEKKSKVADKHSENVEKEIGELDPSDLIQVFETGELTIDPDFAQVVIICSNSKDTVEDVKNSVNKRVDYILQTLRSHHVGKTYCSVDRRLTRSDAKYELSVEITVQFENFTKCQEVSNYLVEKLDSSVEISKPSFHYHPGKLNSLRRQTCVLAVQNARVKGLEIANSLNQTLGQARFIQELTTDEFSGTEQNDDNSSGRKTFQQLLKLASITIVVKVLVVFCLKVKHKR